MILCGKNCKDKELIGTLCKAAQSDHLASPCLGDLFCNSADNSTASGGIPCLMTGASDACHRTPLLADSQKWRPTGVRYTS